MSGSGSINPGLGQITFKKNAMLRIGGDAVEQEEPGPSRLQEEAKFSEPPLVDEDVQLRIPPRAAPAIAKAA